MGYQPIITLASAFEQSLLSEQLPILAESAISAPAVQPPTDEAVEGCLGVDPALPANIAREVDSYMQVNVPALTIRSSAPPSGQRAITDLPLTGISTVRYFEDWDEVKSGIIARIPLAEIEKAHAELKVEAFGELLEKMRLTFQLIKADPKSNTSLAASIWTVVHNLNNSLDPLDMMVYEIPKDPVEQVSIMGGIIALLGANADVFLPSLTLEAIRENHELVRRESVAQPVEVKAA